MAEHTTPRRSFRRAVGPVALGVLFLALTWWVNSALGDLGEQLRTARADNKVLTQQVRDLGGVPRVSPSPGPAGTPGSPGSPGVPGSPGASGRPGERGPGGSSGRPGASGAPGKDGQAGQPGASGAAGPPGEAGPRGEQGPPGPACPTGYRVQTGTVMTADGPVEAAYCVREE